MIVSARIAPGSRLTENDISDTLGVSRTPAREALQRLHRDGFLVPRGSGQRKELVVTALTRDDLEELYRAMSALEGMAAARVTLLSATARRSLASEMRATNASFQRLAKTDPTSYDELFTLHNRFHEAFVSVCAGPRLRALISSARAHVDRYEWMYAPFVGPNFEDTFEEHLAILAAIKDGTAAQAERAVRANWDNGAERLLAAIGRAGARGDWVIR